MKKIFAITLAFLLILSVVGCGTRSKSDDSESTASPEEIAELQEDFAALAEDIADLTEKEAATPAANDAAQSSSADKSATAMTSD